MYGVGFLSSQYASIENLQALQVFVNTGQSIRRMFQWNLSTDGEIFLHVEEE